MAGKLVHPDTRIDALEKRLAQRERELAQLKKTNDEMTRRLSGITATLQAHAQRLFNRS